MIPFLITCVAIELTPGPNMAYLTLLSSLHGKKAGFLMVLGIASGLFVVGLLCALGAATLLQEHPYFYQLLRWAGVAYMLWLAYDCWKDSSKTSDVSASEKNHFLRGFVTNILNPKAAVFYMSVLPSFSKTPDFSSILILTISYVCVATLVHGTLVVLADTAAHRLSNPAIKKRLAQIFSILLIIIAIWLAYHTRGSL